MPDTVLQVNPVLADLKQCSHSGSKPDLSTLIQLIGAVDLHVDVGGGLSLSMFQASERNAQGQYHHGLVMA